MSVNEDVMEGIPPKLASRNSRVTRWPALIVATGLLIGASATCAGLAVRFLGSRPLDLRPESHELSVALDRVLEQQGIATARIKAGPEVPMEDTGGLWYERRYDVAVPRDHSIRALAQAIQAQLPANKVTFSDASGETSGVTELRLEGHGRDMAIVRLQGAGERADLRSATRAVAETVSKLLSTNTPTLTAVSPGAPIPKSNENADWENVRIAIQLPETVAPGAVIASLRERITDNQVTIEPNSNGSTDAGPAAAAVLYKGFECVDVMFLQPLPRPLLAASRVYQPLLSFELAGIDYSDVMKTALPNQEELPLDSSELNGDALLQAMPGPEPREFDTPRLAIIIDDGGYGGPITEEILTLSPKLTLSILPHTPFGTDTAVRAERLGFQVMLHMPMENSVNHLTFPGQITTDMTPDQIHAYTKEALEEIPGAVGINNHTGSKFTSNAAAMKVFLEGIENTKLFFVDSRTIGTTQAYHVARELRIPSAARDLFLDHESDPTYIRARFKQLIEICKHQGSAIGICHFRKNTVPILEEYLPVIEKDGIKLVHVSELIQ